MSDAHLELGEAYRSAMADALAGADETLLERAYELGRGALGGGAGVVDLATLHHRATVAALGDRLSESTRSALAAAHAFFLECLSPYEMSLRTFREANTALRHINDMLEDETRRIAQALHDEAGQLLVSVHLALKALEPALPPTVRGRLREVRDLLDGIEAQLRRVSHELRPPVLDDLGLVPAVEFLASGITARHELRVEIHGSTGGRLPRSHETALYRIIQEGVTNIVRHAHATRAVVELIRHEYEVVCMVRDDGAGFDMASHVAGGGETGLGLIGIRERVRALGGILRIRSSRGHGTELCVTLPMEVAS